MADKTHKSSIDTLPAATTSAAAVSPQQQQEQSSIVVPFKPYSTCSCTKILITQLFHEMKQEFPTVPDEIVKSYAHKHCHDRAACIEELRRQSDEYPGSVNPYPAVLRHKPMRRAPAIPIVNDQPSNSSSKSDRKQINDSEQSLHPQRPNTLNLVRQQMDGNMRPPMASHPKTDKYVDTPPVNVSLNVIVSPVTGRPPLQPMRITSAATATDAQYENNPQQHIHRSVQEISPGNFRSVSFTLHKPNSAGVSAHLPNLDASIEHSSDTPAKMGYQSRLEITVGGSNGGAEATSAASRLRPDFADDSARNGIAVMSAAELLEDAEIVNHQLMCKQRLINEIEKERRRLEAIKREIIAISGPFPEGGAIALAEEIDELRKSCIQMDKEVDEADRSYARGNVSGPRLTLPSSVEQSMPANAIASTNARPSTVPSSSPHRSASQAMAAQLKNDDQLDAQSGWECKICTFRNHELLNKCEQCEMPLLSAGNRPVTDDCATATRTYHRPAPSLPMQLRPHPNIGVYPPYPPYPPNHQQSPTRIHIPYQQQTAVTVANGGRLQPIVYAYATPP